MIVRRALEADFPLWARMLASLHPDQTAVEFESELRELTALPEPYVGFIAFADDGEAAGMIDTRVRNYAEGAGTAPAAYVEDLWVEPLHRRSGVARALLAAVEQWAREQGLAWLGSDAVLGNDESHSWHRGAGFDEIERLVIFGKPLA